GRVPRGNDGQHQLRNRTDEAIRVLMLSTLVAPDLVSYPDSGKFAARDVNGERVLLRRPGTMLDYWDGED
ncbi:MAG: cupin domain-containing protein, partial [Solirubrobacteraceae bacterium]